MPNIVQGTGGGGLKINGSIVNTKIANSSPIQKGDFVMPKKDVIENVYTLGFSSSDVFEMFHMSTSEYLVFRKNSSNKLVCTYLTIDTSIKTTHELVIGDYPSVMSIAQITPTEYLVCMYTTQATAFFVTVNSSKVEMWQSYVIANEAMKLMSVSYAGQTRAVLAYTNSLNELKYVGITFSGKALTFTIYTTTFTATSISLITSYYERLLLFAVTSSGGKCLRLSHNMSKIDHTTFNLPYYPQYVNAVALTNSTSILVMNYDYATSFMLVTSGSEMHFGLTTYVNDMSYATKLIKLSSNKAVLLSISDIVNLTIIEDGKQTNQIEIDAKAIAGEDNRFMVVSNNMLEWKQLSTHVLKHESGNPIYGIAKKVSGSNVEVIIP